jgi:hypothetical protein
MGAKTLSIPTFRIKTLNLMDLFATLSIRVLNVVMLSIAMLSAAFFKYLC